MSAAVAYDTLKIARQLTQAGLDAKVAEGVSETFANVLLEREDALATRADLAALRSDLGKVETVLKGDIALLRGELQSQGHELKAEIRSGNVELIKWMFGGLLAFAGALFAAIKLF